MDDDTLALLYAARQQAKACQRATRTLAQILAQLEERLALETAQPKEGTANGTGSYETRTAAAAR